MCFSASTNGLNNPIYNNNNNKDNDTQEAVSNYIENTENQPQQKNLHDYTINTKEEHKLKKIASFILNAIKYFLCVAFFPITIIVLIVIKLNSLKSNDSKLKEPTTQATLEKQVIQERAKELNATKKALEEFNVEQKEIDELVATKIERFLKEEDQLKASRTQQTLKKLDEQELDYKKAEESINKNSMEDAYNNMFNTSLFSKMEEIQNKSMTAIETRDFLSKLFIQDIKDELGKITEEEQQIIETMKSLTDLKFQHQSDYNLVENNTLKIYSRDRIKLADTKEQMNLNSNTRENIGCYDFVPFSVDFSGSSIKTPPTIKTHGNSFYGEKSYVIPENIIDKNGYFTLVNQTKNDPKVRSSCQTSRVLYDNGMGELAELFYAVYFRILSSKYNLTPIFSLEDIRLGMALYIIKGIRKLDEGISNETCKEEREILHNQRAKFMTYLLKREENQNKLLNAMLHLEYHAPVKVEAKLGEYSEHNIGKILNRG